MADPEGLGGSSELGLAVKRKSRGCPSPKDADRAVTKNFKD